MPLSARHLPALLLTALPALARASEADVLAALWWQLGLLAVVLLSLPLIRLPLRWRLAAVAAYCGAHVLAWLLVGRLPYLAHQQLVDSVFFVLPLLAWLGVLLTARRRVMAPQ